MIIGEGKEGTVISILINGIAEPYTVLLDSPLSIDWRTVAFDQAGYTLRITDEQGQQIFKEEKQATAMKVNVDLSHLEQVRQTYFVQLTLFSTTKEQRKLTSQFTTASKRIQEAEWITRLDNPILKEATYFRDNPTIVLSKQLKLDTSVKQAWIDLCGLGYYTLFINGKRVGKDYLINDVTNYNKVVYYDTYEITKYLTVGENCISVELGNGWYNPAPINILGKYNVRKQLSIGKPCLIASIEVKDFEGNHQQVLTDTTWKSAEGNILMNNVFVGEKVTDQCGEKKAKTVKILGPAGTLIPGSIPKIQRVEKSSPKKITTIGNKVIVDFGEILSGQISLTVSKNYLGKIILNYSERMYDKKALDFSSTISGVYGITDPELGITPNQRIIQSDTLEKTKKAALHFSNQYSYHSFRYVEFIFNEAVPFEAVIEKLCAYRVHTNVEVITEFETSLSLLNQLWRSGLQTRLNNIHSYFEDCTRERFGYGGDIVALMSSHQYSINGLALLKKVMIDFINDQTIDGGIPATAPFVGIMTNGPSNKAGAIDWQLVLPTIANSLLRFYDEMHFVQQFAASFKKHIDYLLSFDFDYIKACSLGDWGSIDEKTNGAVITSPDQEFCSACSYSIILQEYQQLMKELAEYESAGLLSKKITEVNQAIFSEYAHANGSFGEGTQSSAVFALKANLVQGEAQKKLIQQLIEKIAANDGVISLGIFGMAWIYELLASEEHQMILFDWLTKSEAPSYQAMLAETGTLSEHFPLQEGAATYNGSLNHAMFSSYSAWMVRQILGISFPEGINGQIFITPQTAFSLETISGSIRTPFGKIQLQWTQTEEEIKGKINLPKNQPYTLNLPTSDWQVEERCRALGESLELFVRLTKG